MGFFTATKPHISEREFRDLNNELYSEGHFSDRDRQEVMMLFRPYLKNQSTPDKPGISQDEIGAVLEEVRRPENMRVHGLTPEKINILEEKTKKFLGKNY
ncbi:MAG: hypothetical protein A3B99_01005 [Candidatus Yanofskybacteria bacterium RIFCSPHIGHO2_02_FULL_44_12b]|uniref:Uncharacterized protein n=2 Tax=Candidatus Yanofskyibacteriota TaxID=1752733 RepID=A0A1F8GL57_9BACT|nr:MAG: hypothetical protein UW79_C0015G0001 [Candidatus Yanofskybacteria bacterium GW2011_GWA2_44_9]OGN04514.1 MAG: hypothetical protein A2659_02110 [Candidatus Yanofskybacteria bacterium RIFCSPHIGHO2_01_FULL_44_24]OGN15808.1 MAG: hypothetical protein A3B99_01005 [Candidatus Yanofskybacteria bacterium RIFCSPHIGHO2_02_FULL_44_12b]OGN26134.1 MAG: hypothetical protein A2925_05025 [Candidatus Yanofskybacteria bacterium RIFCSPLOWO2_01_FULL_44_22]